MYVTFYQILFINEFPAAQIQDAKPEKLLDFVWFY